MSAQTAPTASRLRELLQPPDAKLAADRTLARLDKQFISLEHALDLESLERAVEAVRVENDALKAKSDESAAATTKLVADALAATRAHLHSAQELSLARHALADELSALSEELVSSATGPDRQPTLMEELETLQRTLRELESVRDYIGVLHHALGLSEDAVKAIREAKPISLTHPAIEQYKALQIFVHSVHEKCAGLEGGPITLVNVLESVQRKTWTGIKDVLVSELQAAAEELKWPSAVQYEKVAPGHRAAFEKAFSNLLKLQDIGAALHPTDGVKPGPLYALQGLVQPIALRFKFHFDGDRPTNRPDKPEWFFTHILNTSHEHRTFLETYVQQLLNKGSYNHIDGWREFTRLLFPILTRKIRSTVPLLLEHPSLLAHLIYQTIAFDVSLREVKFGLKGTMGFNEDSGEWDGLADIILNNHEWFEAWLEAEKKFDEDQYLEIISASDAWAIAEEEEDGNMGRNSTESRSTNSARRVKALIEQITDRYQSLPRLPQRVRFLMHVQVPILDQYHARITASLDAFETLSSALARVVPGGLTGRVDVDTKRLTSGVEGASRLVKALITARALETALISWGEDVFFLELWEEITRRPALRTMAERHALLPRLSKEGDEVEGTVFDVLVNAYRQICERAEDMIARQLVGDVEDDLEAYITAPWDEISLSPETLTLPPELAAPIASLVSCIAFLRSTLPAARAIGLYRRIASAICSYIVQRGILYRGRGRATRLHGVKFALESTAWVDACRTAFPGQPSRRIEAPWVRLLSAGKLLSLDGDEWGRAMTTVFGADEQEYESWARDLGLEDLMRNDAKEVLRAREDCRR